MRTPDIQNLGSESFTVRLWHINQKLDQSRYYTVPNCVIFFIKIYVYLVIMTFMFQNEGTLGNIILVIDIKVAVNERERV